MANFEDIMDEDVRVLIQLKKINPSYKLSDSIVKRMRTSYMSLENSPKKLSRQISQFIIY